MRIKAKHIFINILILLVISSCEDIRHKYISNNIGAGNQLPSEDPVSDNSKARVTDFAPGTYRVSSFITDTGTEIQSNWNSSKGSFSPDGTKIVFYSFASNFVENDTNNRVDIFIKDLITGIISRVSTDKDGNEANGNSDSPSFSPDGNKILFTSAATNLVSNSTNDGYAVFIKDIIDNSITMVSTSYNGSHPDADCFNPSFSKDGKKVVFSSNASNLISSDTNGYEDVFVKYLSSGFISRVSTSSTGTQANKYSREASFSPNGENVIFTSEASNLVSDDTNGVNDIFMKNILNQSIIRVSTDSDDDEVFGSGDEDDEGSWGSSFSPDGSKVLFSSQAITLIDNDTNYRIDLFLKDLETGEVTILSTNSSGVQANHDSYEAKFSYDGNKVIFTSAASNLIDGDTNNTYDIYIKDLTSGMFSRVSTNSLGYQSNSFSTEASFSNDGKKIVFTSNASNLVETDTNSRYDIFFVQF